MSSEITALSTFAQYWLPHVSLWIFSVLFSLLGFGVILLGVSDFGKIESLFAIVKLSTLIIIIIFGGLLLFGVRPTGAVNLSSPFSAGLFPNGLMGLWTGFIFILFSFGGMGVVGVTAKELRNKNDVPKAGYTLIITLVGVYILSLTVVLSLAKWSRINESESPFVTALSTLNIPFIGTIFNIVIITAAFSTMIGALYSITNIIVSLAEGRDAPQILSKRNSKGVALPALILTAIVLAVTIVVSYFLPKSVYEYLTASAGVMLLLNWIIILFSHFKNRKSYNGNHFKMPFFPFSTYLTMFIILAAISGALFQTKERIGVIIAFVIAFLFIAIYWISSLVKKGKA
jgi:L-asparagine transporter-like permease